MTRAAKAKPRKNDGRGVRGHRPRHGTLSRYTNYGCRCDLCKAARRRYAAGRDGCEQMVTTVAPIRQLRALVHRGHSLVEVADLYGCSHQYLSLIAKSCDTEARQFTPTTVRKVARIYAELLGGPEPVGTRADRARRTAHRFGWLSHEVWTPGTIGVHTIGPDLVADGPLEVDLFDEVVVERALAGWPGLYWGRMAPPDRTEVLRRLLLRGTTLTSIARLVHSSNDTLMAWRDRYLPELTPVDGATDAA